MRNVQFEWNKIYMKTIQKQKKDLSYAGALCTALDYHTVTSKQAQIAMWKIEFCIMKQSNMSLGYRTTK